MKVALRIGGFVIAADVFWFLLSRIGIDAVVSQLRVRSCFWRQRGLRAGASG